ncbi:MAG: tetratricopeptide repeat protein, partial [Alphaproteobacteria bacterium]|nr:tetratricopeptide repeat protein [Alphaproteobacteria bacterium]
MTDVLKWALSQREQGRLAEAIDGLRRVAGDSGADVAIVLGGLLAEARRHEEAESCLRDAARRWPMTAAIAYNLAKVVRDQGRLAESGDLYARTVELDPTMAPAWRNLGNVLVDLGRPDDAVRAYDGGVAVHHRVGGPIGDAPEFRTTTLSKLGHDVEQFAHLANQGHDAVRMTGLAARYERVLSRMRAAPETTILRKLSDRDLAEIGATYNRLLHRPEAPRLPGGALNAAIDWRAVERDYLARPPGMTWIDGLLNAAALASLRRYCLEATIWFSFRYANGYLGAFMENGFSAPLMLQIAEELRAAAPAIFAHHSLRKYWAYKYDARLQGIPVHADFAAVNVNFWITPDDANLDPEGGGLVVWDVEAPADWDFAKYNADDQAIRRFLRETNAKAMPVPYRQNRVLIFNSDLFHRTGDLAFKPGYANRRVNITMLYG